jgi:hypothetical protein
LLVRTAGGSQPERRQYDTRSELPQITYRSARTSPVLVGDGGLPSHSRSTAHARWTAGTVAEGGERRPMTDDVLSPETRMVEALVQLERAQEQLEADEEELGVVLSSACDDVDWVLEELDRRQKQGLDRSTE